jgi:hypothetical protein
VKKGTGGHYLALKIIIHMDPQEACCMITRKSPGKLYLLRGFEAEINPPLWCYKRAAKGGYVRDLKWLYKMLIFKNKKNLALNPEILTICCKNGRLAAVKWLMDIYEKNGKSGLVVINNCYAFELAIEWGQLEVIKYLYGKFGLSPLDNVYDCFGRLAKYGHIDALKWFCDNVDGMDKIILYEDAEMFKQAVRNGHLKMAKFIYNIFKKKGRPEAVFRGNMHYFNQAVLNGHLAAIKWVYGILRKMGLLQKITEIIFMWALKNSIQYDYINILKWLLSLFGNTLPKACMLGELFAAAECRLEILQILFDGNREKYDFRSKAMDAAYSGRIDVLEWVFYIKKSAILENKGIFEWAAENGEIEAVYWIYDIFTKHNISILSIFTRPEVLVEKTDAACLEWAERTVNEREYLEMMHQQDD